jgi:hypothetical protein
MAEARPMGGETPQTGGQSQPLSNLTYDLVTVMHHCGKAVNALDAYIADARKENDPDAANVLEQIRRDTSRHCDLTRDVLDKRVKQGKF